MAAARVAGDSPRRGGAGMRRRCQGRPGDRRREVAMIDDGAAPGGAGEGQQAPSGDLVPAGAGSLAS